MIDVLLNVLFAKETVRSSMFLEH